MKKIIPNDAILVPGNAELKFKGMIFDTYQWPQKLFDGSEHTFEMLKRTDTVTAICVIDDQIIVIEDEQPYLGKRISFPGGRVDKTDESNEAAVKREIHEETGYSFKNWRLIEVRQPYRKIEWFVHVYVAYEKTGEQPPHLDPGEKINVSSVNFDQLKSMANNDLDYLGEVRSLLKDINNIDELLNLKQFEGKTVER